MTKEFKYCIITLYIEETPDTNISNTSNELIHITAFIYQSKQKRTLISHTFRFALGLIPFPKPLINPFNSHFDVHLDNAFKVEQKVKYKSDLGITGCCVQWNISSCAVAKGMVILIVFDNIFLIVFIPAKSFIHLVFALHSIQVLMFCSFCSICNVLLIHDSQ